MGLKALIESPVEIAGHVFVLQPKPDTSTAAS
jgi:hypothetical protein